VQNNEPIPNWPLYRQLTFLKPFVNQTKSDDKKKEMEEMGGKLKSFSKAVLDEHLLVKLIKQRPALFDKKHEDFRVSSSRRIAWDEIGEIMKFDTESLIRRWRVIRDRFVRELRKTKDKGNADNLSPLFREMLFVVPHVRSKKYEVEADGELSDNSRDYDYDSEQNSEQHIVVMANEDENEHFENEVEQEEDFQEYYETENLNVTYETHVVDMNEQNHINHINENVDAFDYVEDLQEGNENDNLEKNGIIDAVIENEQPTYILTNNSSNSRSNKSYHLACKRRASSEIDVESQRKIIKNVEPQSSSFANVPSPTSIAVDSSYNNDEDIAFGNTIGCMLKKIPQNLKTSIKLKLLQSFAEFETLHKLN
jgi:hypothetical protein